MTVSEKHRKTARRIASDKFILTAAYDVDRDQLAEEIAAALAAAEREGREDERKRCAEIAADFEDEDILLGQDVAEIIRNTILSQANTHSVALPPGATEQAGTVYSSAVSATHHASRNGRGE